MENNHFFHFFYLRLVLYFKCCYDFKIRSGSAELNWYEPVKFNAQDSKGSVYTHSKQASIEHFSFAIEFENAY